MRCNKRSATLFMQEYLRAGRETNHMAHTTTLRPPLAVRAGAIVWNAPCSSLQSSDQRDIPLQSTAPRPAGSSVRGMGEHDLEFHPSGQVEIARLCSAGDPKSRGGSPRESFPSDPQKSWLSPVLGPRDPCRNLKRWRQTSHLDMLPPAALCSAPRPLNAAS